MSDSQFIFNCTTRTQAAKLHHKFIMAEPIPYLDLKAQLKPLRAEIDAAIARTIDNCSFCLGPDVAQFEKDFAKFCGAEHCVAFNSGTSALHVAMRLLNVGPGDEVITTPFTFVATSWAISYVGAKPVFVDIDDATFNLDPQRMEAAITPRTKAVMPVHLYGQPFDLGSHPRPLPETPIAVGGGRRAGAWREIPGPDHRDVWRDFLLQFLSRQESGRVRRRRRAGDEPGRIRQTRAVVARTRLGGAVLSR